MSGAYLFDPQLALIGESPTIGFGDDRFAVCEAPRDLVNELVARNHYSRRVYLASTLHFGVFLDGALRGALQFGYAMNPASAGSVVAGTGMDEYLELNRMWLDDALPRNSESRAVAYAIRAIRRMRPRVRWIQSFADERCGRFGVVYQACNFLYLGEHTSIFYELDGEFFHNTLMTNSKAAGQPRARRLLANRERARPVPLRYIFFLQPRFRAGLRFDVLPYPKAAGPADEPSPEGASPVQPRAAAPPSPNR